MTDRVAKLRKQSVEAVPHIDISRARLFTEAYKLYDGSLSVPEMRAMAFYHYMKYRPLCLSDGELIVGEKGDAPQAAPTFPELCCHTPEDMDVMDSRERIFFKVSAEAKRVQEEEIIPYWHNRSMRARMLELMDDEWKACYSAGLFTEFMEQRGPGHTVGGDVFYKKGFLQRKAEIEEALKALDYLNDMEASKKRDQLKAMAIACDAIMLYADRCRALALEAAQAETDETRRKELIKISENCAVVPAYAPKSYHQAIQMYWFVHIGVTTELNPWDAFSPGRLDQHLYPFYKADIEKGELTSEEALELLECLWVKFNNQPAPPKVGITLKESSTYTDFVNINTGGIDPDGRDGVNPVSYLILDCMDEMRLLQPSSNVQISRKTPQRFLLRALEIARKGWGQPAFYNTEAIVQELLNAGKSIEDARRGGASGCVETGCFGSEAYILTGYFNLPKILEITLNDG
ncbi:MAG: pyruvate formate lyase family protein, partial [Eubacteriales bacterium]|nr:pyruvate formate lyase family protein [Eubacteriales bacterium]